MSETFPFREDFQCQVIWVRYDFKDKMGTVCMPELNCTDMSGAIRFFTAIDPDVERIVTQTSGPDGEVSDTQYVRSKTGASWSAVPTRR